MTEVDLSALGDVAVLEFGPGEFRLRGSLHLREDRESFEVRGAGMDRTRLDCDRYTLLGVAEGCSLRNLSLHDLALSGGGPPLSVSGDVAAVVENVRFIGWESAGHSSAVGVSGRAFLALRNCEMLGEDGGICSISLRGGSLLLAEDCFFADTFSTLLGWGGAAAKSRAAFRGCRFENIRLTDGRFLVRGAPEFPLVVQGGNVRYGEPALDAAARKEAWGAGFAAEVAGVAFTPGIPRCTVKDLAFVAERANPKRGEVLVGIRADEVRAGGRPLTWSLFYADLTDRRVRAVACFLDGDALVERPGRASSLSLVTGTPEEMAPIPALSTILRATDLPAATDVRSVALSQGGQGFFWEVRGPWPATWRIDATTGRLLESQ